MKRILCVICSLVIFFTIAGCSNIDNYKEDNNLMHQSSLDTKSNVILVYVTSKNNIFIAEFKNNETTQALISKFPLTINMAEKNSREKYYNFPEDFHHMGGEKPNIINTGEIMIWSKNCLVLFYKTFSNNYNGYVSLGRIQDVTNLEKALGNGDTEVTFTLIK